MGAPEQPLLYRRTAGRAAHYERGRDAISDDAYAKRDEANMTGAAVEGARAANEQAKYEAETEHNQAVANELRDRNARSEMADAIAQARVSEGRQQAQAATAAAANMKEDPSRWMNRKDTGTRILMGLGGFLGGFAAGWNKTGGNPFLDRIDAAIENDMKSQRSDMAQAKYKADEAWKSVAGLEKEMGNRESAEATRRQQYYRWAEEQAKALASRANTETAKTNALQAVQHFQDKQADLQAGKDKARYVQAQAGATQVFDARVGKWMDDKEHTNKVAVPTMMKREETGNQLTLDAAKSALEVDKEKQKKQGEATGDPVLDRINGLSGPLREQALKEYETMQKRDAGLRSAGKAVDDAAKNAGYGGNAIKFLSGGTITTESKKRADIANANLAAIAKGAAGPGSNSDKDFDEFVAPFKIQAGDDEETIAAKKAGLMAKLKDNAPTPILSKLGIGSEMPKTAEKGWGGKGGKK